MREKIFDGFPARKNYGRERANKIQRRETDDCYFTAQIRAAEFIEQTACFNASICTCCCLICSACKFICACCCLTVSEGIALPVTVSDFKLFGQSPIVSNISL